MHRAAMADAARCDDTCTALHSPSHPQSPFATSRFFTTRTAPGICQNRLRPSHPPVRGSRFTILDHPRGTAWKCREARFKTPLSTFLFEQDNKAQGNTLGYTVFRQKAAIRRVRSCLGKFTGKRYLFKTGSQVSPTPSFLNILWSTSLSITVQCTWQPRSLGSCSSARRQLSSFSESTESATSTSSVCRRGLRPPR